MPGPRSTATGSPDSATLSRTDASTERSDGAPVALRKRPALAVVLEAERPDAGALILPLDGVTRVVIRRGSERRAERRGAELLLDLADRKVSKPHASLERSGDGFTLSDLGSSNGTFVGDEPLLSPALAPFDTLFRVGHTFLALLEDGGPIAARSASPWPFVTLSTPFARELERLGRVAPSPLPLLLLGETGTGKEVLARAVHERSGRPGPFIAVNCGALPANLVEGLIFGHQKGAFSGALRDELGFVRAADHGTLFLDEIGDLAPAAQASLLRVLQEGEVVAVGAFQPVKVDVRILSATHHPLDERARAGVFRSDLLARLSGFTFQIPPLRERLLDLGVLIAALSTASSTASSTKARPLRPDAALALLTHDYPMNVRELKHALDAASLLTEDVIHLTDLPAAMRGDEPRKRPSSRAPGNPEDASDSGPLILSSEDAALRDDLLARLEATQWNITQVARDMGKARQQIQRWVKRFRLAR